MQRQSILITGASSGLGEGMARAFAAKGRSLALAARRLDRLEALASEVSGEAAAVEVAALDVTDTDRVPVVFDDLAGRLGGLDRIIVNAGLGKGAPLGTGRADANIETVQTNLVGALAQVEAAMTIFRAQGRGHLVLISSVSAVRGLPKAQTAYSASKAGLTAIGEGLQAELRSSPIRVSILLPGYISTDINAGVKSSMMVDRDKGVAALVAAVEREPLREAVPRWPWAAVDLALSHLPGAITRRMV
ncbi:SDR family oxidoreductase [Williamsia deligens]|uniref:SDR family oxidoreductase n=1 Tax=Williamsia deligens TaxID=321325 RepID=A0ABW3G7K9_9NOCA|nr:SDR family oxidoreductase [Williamsia deligens]